MQKIATKVFIAASVAFGVIGVLFILSLPLHDDNAMSDLSHWLQKLLFICAFIILPLFALSVAGKYLKSK